jgi:ribonucleoside-diphosphate reductase alpha chain
MKALQKNGHFDLVNPRTKQKVRTLKARAVFDLIVNAAWRTGDPGLIFLDEINRRNPTPGIGMIEATNPCGEVPLLPFESCNLGSINLVKMVTDGRFDWQRLRDRIRWSIRFLDNVIEVNRFPLPQIREITFANRKIGLGVMGFADMLIRLGIPYNSPEAVRFARRLMRFIRTESLRASAGLADERGVFPNFDRSVYGPRGLRLRNATVNTVAPTGTISIIAGCSSGIEPLFAVSFVRNVLSGTRLFETNPIFEEMARNRGIYSREIIAEMARVGSLRTVRGVPADLRKLFVTAFDVSPEEHLDIQSAFQAYTDNSVSKTINLSADATVEDVRSIYLRAYRSRCKGITVYRYGSREEQVLSFYSPKEKRESSEIEFVSADSDYSGGCAAGLCSF